MTRVSTPQRKEYLKNWYFKNKHKVRERGRIYALHKFGLTSEQWDEMLKNQNHSCAICHELQSDKRRLCVDHCHATNQTRGLLCDNCNTALGKFKDSTVRLENAIHYLEKFE